MVEPLRVGSLFAGIGGFDLGFERAGMKTAWLCERDRFCRYVLRKHWPDAPIYEDVRFLPFDRMDRVDLLCGGFPCQDISHAGKQAGIRGSRSAAWAHYAFAIRQLQPRWVVVENVAVLRKRGLDVVLGDLASLGYDAEWDCVRAADVGAPHLRDRIWIVAYPDSFGRQARAAWAREYRARGWQDADERGVSDTDRLGREGRPDLGQEARERSAVVEEPADGGGGDVADADALGRPWERLVFGPQGWQESASRRRDIGRWWAAEPGMDRVAHGVPRRVDRCHALGNALVPQVAEWIGHRIMETEALVG